MGSRACYVIIEYGAKRYFYHHWGAQTIPQDVFWGPRSALSYIETLSQADGLIASSYCEGAVAIDCDRKRLLLFGGEDILFCNSLRRVYLALLRIQWAEWQVAWAEDELGSIARAVGDDFTELENSEFVRPRVLARNDLEDSLQWDGAITSIRQAGQLRHYEIDFQADDLLWQGEQVIATLGTLPAGNIRRKGAGADYTSFLYIDADSAQVCYGIELFTHYRLHTELKSIWTGWHVDQHRQGMYKHAQLCGLNWQDYLCPRDEQIGLLSEILLREYEREPADILQALRDHGAKVEVADPAFFQDHSPQITLASKSSLLAATLQRWLAEDNHYENALRAGLC